MNVIEPSHDATPEPHHDERESRAAREARLAARPFRSSWRAAIETLRLPGELRPGPQPGPASRFAAPTHATQGFLSPPATPALLRQGKESANSAAAPYSLIDRPAGADPEMPISDFAPPTAMPAPIESIAVLDRSAQDPHSEPQERACAGTKALHTGIATETTVPAVQRTRRRAAPFEKPSPSERVEQSAAVGGLSPQHTRTARAPDSADAATAHTRELIERIVTFATLGRDESGLPQLTLGINLLAGAPARVAFCALGKRRLRMQISGAAISDSSLEDLLGRIRARGIDIVEVRRD